MTIDPWSKPLARVKVTIHFFRTLIPAWAAAQVIVPRKVFVREGVNLTRHLLAHELVHVMQWEHYGIRFGFLYLCSVARHGYHDSPYEIEARQLERHPAFLTWADDLLHDIDNGRM